MHYLILIILGAAIAASIPQDIMVRRDDPPIPANNYKGFGACDPKSGQSALCNQAIDRFQDDKQYASYSSCVATGLVSGTWPFSEIPPWGCTAIYTCDKPPKNPSDGESLVGFPMFSGHELKDLFHSIYASTEDHGAGCGVCGSVYMKKGVEISAGLEVPVVCRVTLNYCANCNDVNCGGVGLTKRLESTEEGGGLNSTLG